MTDPLPDFDKLRAEMVESQLVARGIQDTARSQCHALRAARTICASQI